MDLKLILRYVIPETIGIVVMAVALFWSAGEIRWWPAWAAIAVMIGWSAATAIVILRFNPTLLAERLGPRRGAKRWDTAILSMLGNIQLGRYVVAGHDHRYGWTGSFPLAAQLTRLGVFALGYVLFAWAIASNAYFSQIVRVQSERGHAVVTGGPYHYVRHPAYLGAIVSALAAPILFASWWCCAASGFEAILLVLRTALEDRTLQAELNGYCDYARHVRCRLLPGVW